MHTHIAQKSNCNMLNIVAYLCLYVTVIENLPTGRDEMHYVTPKMKCSMRNLHQSFRRSHDILPLTNVISSLADMC